MSKGKLTPGPGGSFAPKITESDLSKYESLAKACSDPMVSGYMNDLIHMVRTFLETPESTNPGTPYPAGGLVVPLEQSEIDRIDPVVPWRDECNLMARVFEKLVGEIRHAAMHLLWYAFELTSDREPMTADKV